jgi:hypothetical protein
MIDIVLWLIAMKAILKYGTIIFFILTALVVGAAQGSKPNKQTAARTVATITLYDAKCEGLPQATINRVEKLSNTTSTQDVRTASVDVLTDYDKQGKAAWCKEVKPGINIMLKAMS